MSSPRPTVFDVEILYNIKKNRIKCCELPITWIHKEGSNMTLKAIFNMFFHYDGSFPAFAGSAPVFPEGIENVSSGRTTGTQL